MSGNEGRGPDPTAIIGLTTAYWQSQVLFTAHRLGVFEQLGRGALRAGELAEGLGLAPEPTRLLLNACVGLGLLERDGDGRYANAAATRTFLLPGGDAFLGGGVRYGDDMWDAWAGLAIAVRGGGPRINPAAYTGDDPERTRRFVYAMHNRALGVGRGLVELLDLSGRRQLLDVGGGPGTYSALLTRRYPTLRATVLDLPGVVALAREILASMDAGDRVATLAGNYRETEFPAGCDAVLISGVFHRESAATCRELIARARAALAPGGLLAVADVFTDEGGTTPAFAALFGLNMMLSAPDGCVHADADVVTWLEAAGFRDIACRPFPPPLPHRLVTGVCPGRE